MDSETITNQVFTRLICEAGWPISFDECCDRFKGLSIGDCMDQISEHLGQQLAKDWPERYREESYAALRVQVQVMPGAKEAIAHVRKAGIKMCIASSGPMEKMDITLGRTGLAAEFEGLIFNSAMVCNGKPAPDLFLHAAREIGVAAGHCLVIEDSRYGARAARTAGMTCLGYIGGTLKDEDGLIREGAHLISDLQEIAKFI